MGQYISTQNNKLITENTNTKIDDKSVETKFLEMKEPIDNNDSIEALQAKNKAYKNMNRLLLKKINDNKTKLGSLNQKLNDKEIEIEKAQELLNKVKTEYFRTKDAITEYKYNKKNH